MILQEHKIIEVVKIKKNLPDSNVDFGYLPSVKQIFERKIRLLLLTTLDFDGTILRVEGIVMKIHHAGQGRRKPHTVRDRAVAR